MKIDTHNKPEISELLQEHLKVYKRTNYGKILILTTVISVGFIGNLLNNFEDESSHIGVVKINGEIGANGNDKSSGYQISSHLLSAINNPKSKAIIIEANSPGGSPTDAQTINDVIVAYKSWRKEIPAHQKTHLIKSLTNQNLMFSSEIEVKNEMKDAQDAKPIIAIIGKQCASACVQAIMNADIILAQRASLIGNIGVRLDMLNWSKLAEKVGVTNTVLTSGEYKDVLNPWKSIDTAQIAILQEMLVEPVFAQFQSDVITARGDKINIKKAELFSGLAWTGEKSLEIGLVDAISNPRTVQSSLEVVYGSEYKVYSKSTISLGSIIANPFSALTYL